MISARISEETGVCGAGLRMMGHPAAIAGARDQAADLSLLLLEQAHILDGEVPEDPAAFAKRLNRLVVRGAARPS